VQQHALVTALAKRRRDDFERPALGLGERRRLQPAPALPAALDGGRPALLDLRVDPEAISPRATISQLREQARA
jgi:hypothetical protein